MMQCRLSETMLTVVSKYQHSVSMHLTLYRFLAYGLAVVLLQGISPEETGALAGHDYVLIGILGLYTLLKVLRPLRWNDTGSATYALLGGDTLVCTCTRRRVRPHNL